MKSLLFVESPLQLLNAFEAIKKFELSEYILVIRLSNRRTNDRQILYLIEKLKLKNIHIISINVDKRTLIDYSKLFFCRFRYIFNVVDKVFIGNFNSGFFRIIMKQFHRKDIILLDDGAKSIDIQKKFSNLFNYNLFTIYDFVPLKNQKIYKNNYLALKINLNHLVINSNCILFLGLKLSEFGIISEKYYLEIIEKISRNYTDKEIIYVSHREEKKSKLEKIEKFSNLKIIQLDYPVELYGLYQNEIPYKICSLYSTALLTMKKIYRVEVESFKFDYSESEYKNIIDNVYEYYSKYIEVKELDD